MSRKLRPEREHELKKRCTHTSQASTKWFISEDLHIINHGRKKESQGEGEGVTKRQLEIARLEPWRRSQVKAAAQIGQKLWRLKHGNVTVRWLYKNTAPEEEDKKRTKCSNGRTTGAGCVCVCVCAVGELTMLLILLINSTQTLRSPQSRPLRLSDKAGIKCVTLGKSMQLASKCNDAILALPTA